MASKPNRRGGARRKPVSNRPPAARPARAPAPLDADAASGGLGEGSEAAAVVTVRGDDTGAFGAAPPRSASAALRAAKLRATAKPRATVARDYGYVRGELLRIAVLSAILFGGMGILSLFWNT